MNLTARNPLNSVLLSENSDDHMMGMLNILGLFGLVLNRSLHSISHTLKKVMKLKKPLGNTLLDRAQYASKLRRSTTLNRFDHAFPQWNRQQISQNKSGSEA
jgi:hypothetical protein